MTKGFFCGSTIKEERMITFRRLPMLFGAAMMMASAAFAQTGTITVSGTNPEAFSLTDTNGAPLSATLSLGTLTPANNNTLQIATPVTVRIRSNKAYKLSAQASVLSFNTPGLQQGGDDIALTDIGFGITGMTLTGANVANSGSRAETIPAGFDVSGGWGVTATNGLTPAFTKTLNDITTDTQILQGLRVSRKGNMITDNNFISVSFGVAALPQYFTPNASFSSTITLTIASQ
jgi:hypothetical protein